MKRLIPVVLAIAFAGVCFIVAAFVSNYYYSLHLHTALQVRTELEGQVENLGTRLAKLEADKPRHLVPLRARGRISSTDVSPSASATNLVTAPDYELRIVSGKVASIVPDIRIPSGSTAKHEFTIRVESDQGAVIDAWLSADDTEPFRNLVSFDQFRVHRKATNEVALIIQLRTNTYVNISFGLVVLRETPWPPYSGLQR